MASKVRKTAPSKGYKEIIPGIYVAERPTRTVVGTPNDLAPSLAFLIPQKQEHFVVALLDGASQLIEVVTVTIGLANQAPIHAREVFRPAILAGAVTIILAHNHPSGSLEPSSADIQCTERLIEAGKLIGIPVVDHVIMSTQGMTSIREKKSHLWG